MNKIRIDKILVERGLVPSREKAQALIMAGCVLVNEIPITKSGQLVNESVNIRITGQDHPYVSRGGIKLAHALREFKVEVKDKICIDVGASTGGFTDCLLQNGAAKVYAIDVGYGQLDWKLRSDSRVVVMERMNIRKVTPVTCHPEGDARRISNSQLNLKDPSLALRMTKIDLAVIDVSFISLEKVLPHVNELLKKDAQAITLIKPQFEAGKSKVGKGGIVRDEGTRQECVEKICRVADGLKWFKGSLIKSPITGADGNVEFLAWFIKR